MTRYQTILADPPWAYGDPLTMSTTKRGAAVNYPTLSYAEIADLYQPSARNGRGVVTRPGTLAGHEIADVAFCWLWVTKDILLDGIGVRVLNAWGFTPKQIVPWVKGRVDCMIKHDGPGAPTVDSLWAEARLTLQMGMGRITRNVVEYLLIGVRGKNYTQHVLQRNQNGLVLAEEESVILAPRSTHSTKPEAAYALIERTTPGPYLELFARRERDGWTSWGNEIAGSNGFTCGPDVTIVHRPSTVPTADDVFVITRASAAALPDTTDPYADLR
jgi:N6-adenosine-specific RNA methylase IME4